MKMRAEPSGPLDLTNRRAIVFGAAGGIGRAVVRALAREGARVAALARTEKEAQLVAEEIGRNGGKLFVGSCDLRCGAAVEEAVTHAVEELGGIDIAVNCVGVVSSTLLWEADDDEWERVVDTNLRGTFNFLRAVYVRMLGGGGGKIVCLGSIAGEGGGTVSGGHYAASKAGVHAMVRWLAKSGARHGVYVNTVSPGPVMTPMWIGLNDGVALDSPDLTPLGRVGRPEDVAEAVLFLASQMSNFITGVTLDVNGGMLMT